MADFQEPRTSAQLLREFDEYDNPPVGEDPPEDENKSRKGSPLSRTFGALVRGPARALNEISNTAVGLGKTAVKVTGAYKLGDDEAEDNFLDWYHQKTRDVNPLQIPVGERDTGVYGFVESAAQFATGMVAFGAALKPLTLGARAASAVGAAKGTARLASAVDAGVAGAATDLTAFDPYEGRLANIIATSPVPVAREMASLLAADEDDPEVVARLKAATEGILLGTAIEYMIHGIRVGRTKRKLKAGQITPEEAAAHIRGEAEAIAKVTPESVGDVAKVETLHDGSVVVRPVEPVKPDLSALEGLVEPQALEMTARSHEAGRPAAAFLDPKTNTPVPTGLSHDPDAILDPGQRTRILEAAPEGGFMDPDGSWLTREQAADKYKAKSGESSQIRAAIDEAEKSGPLPLVGDVPVKDVAEGHSVGAAFNQAKKAAERPPRVLTDAQKASIQKITERIRSGIDPEDAFNLEEGIDFNFNYVGSTDDAKAVINAISEEMPRPHEPKTWAESIKEAGKVVQGVTGEEMLAHARGLFGDVKDLDVKLLSVRTFLHDHGRQIAKLSTIVDQNPGNAVAVNEMGKMLDNMFQIVEWLAPAESAVGRGLNILKAPIDEVLAKVEPGAAKAATKGAAETATVDGIGSVSKHPLQKLRENRAKRAAGEKVSALDGLSPREVRALARSLAWADGDPNQILKAMTASAMTTRAGLAKGRWWWRLINTLRVENMLSGPVTQAVNASGNAGVAIQIPIEHFMAGIHVPFRRKGNAALRKQGWDEMMGNFHYLKDAAQVAIKSWKTGLNALDPEFGTHEFSSLESNTHVGWRWLGFFRPTRYLMTMDEFFKQLAYRRQIRGMSLRKSAELGLDGVEAARRLADDMDMALTPEGAALNPFALQGSREATFTESLEYGVGKVISEGAEKEPALRILFPFVRTPTNLFRHPLDRTPLLNRASRRYRAELKAGGERKAIAQAKEEMGMMMYAMGAYLVYNGHITGGGPKDYNLNKQWQEAGNKPYTANILGKRRSYRRFEPIATPIAMIADFIETLGDQPDDVETGEMVQGLTAAMVANATNKTFFTGVSSFFDAVSSGDPNKFGKFGTDLALSFYPNLLAQTNPDPIVREVEGMLQRLQARVPGWSQELEPHRNLFGEQVMKAPGYFNRALNPFTTWKIPEDDDVAQTLVRFGRAMTMPTETKADGRINLKDRQAYDNGTGQSPYDRWMELLGTPLLRGQTLRQALDVEIKSRGYQSAGAGTEAYPGGERWARLNGVVTKYIGAAEEKMVKEYKLLAAALENEGKLKNASMMTSDTTLLNRR